MRSSIPSSLGNFTQVLWFQLDNNRLSGPIPSSLGNLAEVKMLTLDRNQLGGPIPSSLGSLSKLESLWLSENRFTGLIPPSLGSLSKLEELFLNDNPPLDPAPVPGWLPASLLYLDLSRTNRTGAIPSALGSLHELRWLALGDNRLDGPVPGWIDMLADLELLDLGGNLLTGAIPSDVAALSGLETLRLGPNDFPPAPPPLALGGLTGLRSLGLAGCGLTGELPVWLFGLTSLESLDLSRNHLTGGVPPGIAALSSLRELLLNANVLQGEVPASITALVNLDAGGSDFRFNGLWTSAAPVRDLLSAAQMGGAWESTQTVPPTEPTASWASLTTAIVRWHPIGYATATGRYVVSRGPSPAGPFEAVAETAGTTAGWVLVDGLAVGSSYAFAINTITGPSPDNANQLTSGPSAAAVLEPAPRNRPRRHLGGS